MTQAEKTAKRLVTMYFQIQEPYFRMPDLRLAKKDALICLKRERALLSHLFCRGMLKQSDCTKMMKELEEVKQAINKM